MQLFPFGTNVCILFQLIAQGYIKEKIGITNFLTFFIITESENTNIVQLATVNCQAKE